MTDLLPQSEADSLLAMEKHRADENRYELPDTGGKLTVNLISADGTETFLLDVSRNRINLARAKYQTRARSTVVLARLDTGGPPHRNPDDSEIACPHLHIYREGFGDRWAVSIPNGTFLDLADFWQTLNDFMIFVRITRPPMFSRSLFT